MTDFQKTKKHGFTIVELVIVIAVIAILAGVLIPTFSGIVNKAQESKAMQEAKNAWNEISMTYVAGYAGFAADGGDLNGWYYDYLDGVAKYDIDRKYTVTYDGEKFTVTAFDPEKSLTWGAITASAIDYVNFAPSDIPFGLTLTYYQGINTRGFSWLTASGNATSKLYVVKSNSGAEADFSTAEAINGTYVTTGGVNMHKAHVTGLTYGETYSYKVGSESGWKYGTFRVDQANPTSITAVMVSDAQTKDPALLNVWENTMAQAVETAGRGLDFILYNGDQADNSAQPTSKTYDVHYEIARATVAEYVRSLPYMAAAGNHEPAGERKTQQILYRHNDIDYGVDGVETDGYTGTGGYYSYDYGFAHFVVLDSNDTTAEQIDWLKADLAATSAKWKIVMMHNGPYATGDHSNRPETQRIITTFTPIFSQYHVDLVLQAHDHTYNKTLPYRWNATGYTVAYNDDTVVNFNVQKVTGTDGKTYDYNPNGTYYVTTGAAGHRYGEAEKNDGCWADALGTGLTSSLSPLDPEKTFLDNQYKIEVGTITEHNDYTDVEVNGVNNDQNYEVGDPATGNVNATMFGVLNITEKTLTYDFYTVSGDDVKLFDTLHIMKG